MLFTSSLLSCLPQDEFAATPLMAASDENHPEVTRFLIASGADLNCQTKVFDNMFCFRGMFTIPHISLQEGMSSLQFACDSGNTDIVKVLIQSNANIELKNRVGVVLIILLLLAVDNHFIVQHTGETDRTNDSILARSPVNSDGADQSWS